MTAVASLFQHGSSNDRISVGAQLGCLKLSIRFELLLNWWADLSIPLKSCLSKRGPVEVCFMAALLVDVDLAVRLLERIDVSFVLIVRGNPTMPATLLRLMWDERNRQGDILSAQTFRQRIKETASKAETHRAASVDRVKRELQLRTLRWPSRSHDMNLIEYVWGFMKLKIQQHPTPPVTCRPNAQQLRQVLTNIWAQLPQDFLRRLILSMPQRVGSSLLARVGYTPYWSFLFSFSVNL